MLTILIVIAGWMRRPWVGVTCAALASGVEIWRGLKVRENRQLLGLPVVDEATTIAVAVIAAVIGSVVFFSLGYGARLLRDRWWMARRAAIESRTERCSPQWAQRPS